MSEKRPSNMIIRVFISILAIFGIFLIGLIINHIFREIGSEEERVVPEKELVEDESTL